MAEAVGEKPVSLDAICLSTQTDCLITDSDNTDALSSAEFTLEERYKHALQFYKGIPSVITLLGSDRR